MNSDFGGVLSPIFRSEYGQSIQMQYICVSFLAKSQLREYAGFAGCRIERAIAGGLLPASQPVKTVYGVWPSGYWSLARTAEAPLEHNFRYPRIRELTVDNDAIALGHRARTF